MIREALDGPAIERSGKRVVQRLLGKLEITEEANQRREHASRVGSVDRFDLGSDARFGVVGRGHTHSLADLQPQTAYDGRSNSIIGRTSIDPNFAEGIFEAI